MQCQTFKLLFDIKNFPARTGLYLATLAVLELLDLVATPAVAVGQSKKSSKKVYKNYT